MTFKFWRGFFASNDMTHTTLATCSSFPILYIPRFMLNWTLAIWGPNCLRCVWATTMQEQRTPRKQRKNTENFYVLTPERERMKAAYAVKGKKELSELWKDYERSPKAKCALHLRAFIEFSRARPHGTRLFWLAKKNVIKAQLELGQASNHFLPLSPSDCL